MFNQLVISQNKPLQSSFTHCCEVIDYSYGFFIQILRSLRRPIGDHLL